MPGLPATFKCFLVTKDAAGQAAARVESLPLDRLPAGDVLIRVAWSSLNYKDALSATGHSGVTRRYPHVPGIDAAGVVEASNASQWTTGDEVLVTGYELGANHWGGYAEFIRVPAEWVVALPAGLTARESMIYGTAGFTAGQCVTALVEHGVAPESGEIAVTGASGGVGSLAVGILARLGYRVVAVSGKPAARELLLQLGAREVIDREAVDDRGTKPLLNARWAGAVDTVGGNTLATLLRSTQNAGCVAACGLVGGAELPMTVYPFILRGVSLIGIDSAWASREKRLTIWSRLAAKWKPAGLEALATEIDWSQLDQAIERILAGQAVGRTIVKPNLPAAERST